LRTITRKGWTGSCPHCDGHFLYTRFNNQEPTPFFYCDRQSDILLRESDQKLVREAYKTNRSSDPELKQLWDSFLDRAPTCLCGGRFAFWQAVICPTCGKEFPHPQGPEFASMRIHEPQIIILDGRHVIGDNSEESYQMIVTLD
jgi:uncharacterized protein (DUF983 family)